MKSELKSFLKYRWKQVRQTGYKETGNYLGARFQMPPDGIFSFQVGRSQLSVNKHQEVLDYGHRDVQIQRWTMIGYFRYNASQFCQLGAIQNSLGRESQERVVQIRLACMHAYGVLSNIIFEVERPGYCGQHYFMGVHPALDEIRESKLSTSQHACIHSLFDFDCG